jgi:hypothetical protein
VDPASLTISDNSRIISTNVIPDPEHSPRVVNHLALAEELYQRKLSMLQERRELVRSRTRSLHALSFAIFAGSAIGVGALSIAGANRDSAGSTQSLRQGGYVALGGLAAGTLMQVMGYMQEDPASIDAKAQRLQAAHSHMLDRIRTVASGQPPVKEPGSNAAAESLMSAAIESFMTEATQINVQG